MDITAVRTRFWRQTQSKEQTGAGKANKQMKSKFDLKFKLNENESVNE